ncbi:MAG: ABC transporter ATP-binding protein [Candidatus Hydrogenedentes bacterium]|nr:ABC transporter ATP-binding protein [Candidatus Hydrogenedentota bacterium]
MSPTFWRFLRYTRPYWLLIAGAIACGWLKFSLALMDPWLFGYAIDHILLQADLSYETRIFRLEVVLGILTLGFIVRAVVTYYRSYLAAVAGNRTIFDIRRDLYRHLQRLSLKYHSTRRTGGTTSRLINDLSTAQGALDRGVVALVMDTVFLCVVVAFLFFMNWRLATISLFTLPFYGLVFRAMNPRLRAVSTDVQREMEEMSGEVTEKISGLQVVMSFVREKTEEMRFFRRHRLYYNKVLAQSRLQVTLTSIAEFLTEFGPILVIFYGGYLVMTDPLFTVGALVTFKGFLGHLYLPTRRLADYSAELQVRLAALDRVFNVLDSEPDIADLPGATPLTQPVGRLEFKDVSFAYQADQPVLKDISFTIEPGQAVAVVGRSGAGKSTLANLLPRFYDVIGGGVCVDGRDVREVAVRSLREHIGMVLQDTILFSGTIRENILYGRHNATEAEMLRAAQMAHVHEFVSALPDGYDTIIGERGMTLSGGQKQRVSIARAFLRDPRILILDEATSNLDSGAELIIQEALRELMRGRTTLVIAHRLSTIVNCDYVLVLDHGRIVQRGPHNELIRSKGPYRQFCKEQFGEIHLEDLSLQAV